MNRPLVRHLLQRYKRSLLLIVFLLTSSVLILFNGTPGVAKPQEIGLGVFSFFQGLFSSTVYGFTHLGDYLSKMSQLQSDYEQVKAKLERYNGMASSYISLQDENKRLREQVAFHQNLEHPNVVSEIISRDLVRVYSLMGINKGSFHDIKKNFPVIAFQNDSYGLVGKINQVSLTSATVQPILDANLYVSARFRNSRYTGLVSGKGHNQEALLMTYVKKEARNKIQIGELVETAGLDSLYPKGLLIGRVKAIHLKDYETSLDIELQPLISFSKLEYLTVLKVDS